VSPGEVANLWQGLVQHRLTPDRLVEFMEHPAVSELAAFHQSILIAAARRARRHTQQEGHLLLGEWLSMARQMTAPPKPQPAATDKTSQEQELRLREQLRASRDPGDEVGDPEVGGWRPGPRRDPPW
jgi:hypothetical protein